MLEEWWNQTDCRMLANILLRYYGPQSQTCQTIDQVVKALVFEFNFSDRSLEENTICVHVELIETHTRTYGPSSLVFRLSERVSVSDDLIERTVFCGEGHQVQLAQRCRA